MSAGIQAPASAAVVGRAGVSDAFDRTAGPYSSGVSTSLRHAVGDPRRDVCPRARQNADARPDGTGLQGCRRAVARRDSSDRRTPRAPMRRAPRANPVNSEAFRHPASPPRTAVGRVRPSVARRAALRRGRRGPTSAGMKLMPWYKLRPTEREARFGVHGAQADSREQQPESSARAPFSAEPRETTTAQPSPSTYSQKDSATVNHVAMPRTAVRTGRGPRHRRARR